ncbi:lmo0937 family membrane protein [Arachidicoccus terrestris]|uniref:lmo0937 family membrane protein n=1 Tax=Arachidicoccus terrestris TaxID=2875539 RepID=UPI001CC5AED6|nr:lmo0937 family membrane protein [Arachidicoccus terrestris]UAY55549.1 lmo0937 family membrane protein [Arachidicoccus terrestris]
MKGILFVIGIILIIGWIFGFVVYHVAGFLIHLLLIIGLIMIVANLFKGKESG